MGTLEHYLPSYSGDPFQLDDYAKRHAVDAETVELATHVSEEEMSRRYGGLYSAICKLPGKEAVEVDAVLNEYLSRYIVELQNLSIKHTEWGIAEHEAFLAQHSVGKGRFLNYVRSSAAPVRRSRR
jgi:hypothetical protein